MTSPSAPSRGRKFFAVAYALLGLGIYAYSWYDLAHAQLPINVWAFLLGSFGIALVAAIPMRLGAIFAGLLLIAGVDWLGTDAFMEDFGTGLSALIVASWTILFLYGLTRGFRGIDLTDLDGGEVQPPREPQIIALSGYAGAGKDTLAAGLLEDGWTRVSFADKLREFAYALNPFVEVEDAAFVGGYCYVRLRDLVDEVGWDRAKNENPDVRGLLQRLGTDAGREILGENVWVAAAMRDLPGGDLVFTDCRFPNEADAIKAAGGHVVRVWRPGVAAVNGHASEHALDGYPFDAHLLNNSDVATGQSRMRKLAGMLRP